MKTRLFYPFLGLFLGWSAASAADEGKDSYPLDVCVVSGEKLGSMGTPHVFNHKGQEVRLCCKKCLKEFDAEPAKYMSKIQGSFPMAQHMENLTGKPLEIAFLKNMTHHHQMGMDMAKLATTHTERPELNKLGLEMIGKQSGEILAMNRWLEEWHQEKPRDRANGPMMNRMMGPQAALKKARGADFDQLFINMMIRHHQGAVQMAKIVQEKSDNEVLKTFVDKLINDETQEITQLENWKKEWFPESQ